MRTPKKVSAAVLSAAALGLAVMACQPQGMPAATDATEAEVEAAPSAEAAATAESAGVMTAAEIADLFAGNTIIGVLDAWKLRWAEFFAPDGTAKALLRFEGQADMRIAGKYYANDQDQFCTFYPELPDQKEFCHGVTPLGDGTYQQVYADGTKGGIYMQILEGEQLEALK